MFPFNHEESTHRCLLKYERDLFVNYQCQKGIEPEPLLNVPGCVEADCDG
jgi:hypothetical protein